MIPDDIKQLFKEAQSDRMGQSEAYKRLIENGEDADLVTKHVITPDQASWLAERQLTIQRIVDGRYLKEDDPQIQKFLYLWNTELGVPWFQTSHHAVTPSRNPNGGNYVDFDEVAVFAWMEQELGALRYRRGEYENRTEYTGDYALRLAKATVAKVNEARNMIKPK